MTHFIEAGARTSIPEKLSFGQKMTVLFCGVTIPRPRAQATPAEQGLAFDEISIRCQNGIQLGAWYCPCGKRENVAQENRNGLIILFHGYAGEKSSELPEAKRFHEFGWSVLLVDFRGSGQSSEAYTSVGYDEAGDVAEAVRYARASLPHSKLVLYGQSMGGVAILRSVHACGVKADALIVEGVFDSMFNTVKHRFESMGVPTFPAANLLMFWGGRQLKFDTFSHNPVEYARSVECPILFMHGTADPRAHLAEARRVFDAVPGTKEFKEFPGAKHESGVNRFAELWNKTISEFLGKVERRGE
jgi:alpha-beta hydrolase superfamily lysophospholipase